MDSQSVCNGRYVPIPRYPDSFGFRLGDWRIDTANEFSSCFNHGNKVSRYRQAISRSVDALYQNYLSPCQTLNPDPFLASHYLDRLLNSTASNL